MASVTYSMRIDANLKREAEAIYAEMGQTLSSAINAFLTRSVKVGGFPFEMRLTHNQKDTVLAMLEAEEMLKDPDLITYDVEEALAELNR